MSILIKGVRLPSNCLHCPMQFGGFCYVKPDWVEGGRVASTVDEAYKQGRPSWCPLEEVPTQEERSNTLDALDCVRRQNVLDAIDKLSDGKPIAPEDVAIAVTYLPSVQPEPISEAYAKAVWTWLLDYQIKAAELKGRYSPYEVLSWVTNDWRKEHERSD